jgi:hypothetical protein
MRQVNQQPAYSEERIAALAQRDERVRRLQTVHPRQRVARGSFWTASSPIFTPMAVPTSVELR